MMQLHTPAEAARWLRARVQGTLQTDSRALAAGDGFIAWPGTATDGRAYVNDALARGAAACVVESQGADGYGFDSEAVAGYAKLKAATGAIAADWFGWPSRALDVIAVTGTNGKTSTSWWLAQALSKVEQPRPMPCAVVGTLGAGVPPALEFNGLTTPDPVLLQRVLRSFVDSGLAACAIEASSIGIAERRLDGTQVRVAIFTNFTQDHLDYHGSMEAYWEAKNELFRFPGLRAAVINLDDAKGVALARMLDATALDVWTISCHKPARLVARDIGYSRTGLRFEVVEGDVAVEMRTSAIGQYNVSNLLGVVAAMRSLGVPLEHAVQACAGLLPVPGRMERIAEQGQPLVAIDYAHTPDALEQALIALQPLKAERGGRLWCVFGCGGNRDPRKRPLMGTAAQNNADRVVVTSDNPRRERPEEIIGQILPGLVQGDFVQIEVDRARAIAQAVSQAEPADVVLIAGKGHEDYQDIEGRKLPFSDHAHARSALAARKAAA